MQKQRECGKPLTILLRNTKYIIIPQEASGWIIDVGQVCYVIYPLLLGVATLGGAVGAPVRIYAVHLSISLFSAAVFLYFLTLFHHCWYHMQLFGRTLVHELQIFIAKLNGTCFFFALLGYTLFCLGSDIKLNFKSISFFVN